MFGLALAVAAGSPGPSLAALVARVIAHGWREVSAVCRRHVGGRGALVDLEAVSPIGWLELTATMLVVLAAVDLGYIWLAARARRLFRSPRAMRLANRGCAGIMGAAAGAIASR